jgi:hypothetical protein
MEIDGSEFVKTNIFHHVLKWFDPEEMLKLWVTCSSLKERVLEELFKTSDINLHESTFTENLGQ